MIKHMEETMEIMNKKHELQLQGEDNWSGDDPELMDMKMLVANRTRQMEELWGLLTPQPTGHYSTGESKRSKPS